MNKEYNSLLVKVCPQPVKDLESYKVMLDKLDNLESDYDETPTRALGLMMDLVSILIEQYEENIFPVPEVSPNELLKHLLNERKLTFLAFAKKIGYSRSAIGNVISGRRSFSKKLAFACSKFFKLPLSTFLRPEDHEKHNETA